MIFLELFGFLFVGTIMSLQVSIPMVYLWRRNPYGAAGAGTSAGTSIASPGTLTGAGTASAGTASG